MNGRIWRRRLIALGAILVVLLCVYRFWLRDSSLVSVNQVEVKGLTANEDEVTASLTQAADGMTTLHVDDEKLARSVQAFPTVASIAANATLLHKLTITVTERLPVAVVKVQGEPTAVASNGLLLPGISVRGQRLPTIDAAVKGGGVDEEGAAQAAIVGGAPDDLRERIDEITWDPDRGGVVVVLEGAAPEIRFGDGSDAEDKWKAVAAVLLDPEREASSYIDVSVPERTVTGG